MDETDDFIDEPEMDRPLVETTQLWGGFSDDVALRFLRLRGIMDEQMQDEALARYAQRMAAPRMPTTIMMAVRSAILSAPHGPRVPALPNGAQLATSGVR